MKTIRKILVANRGEIARRVMRTCREMGIETVAVFSDADASAPFVREADEAVRIGAAPSRESYLVIEKILAVAEQTGADAIHPGYGFLSENAAFARACRERGITFIGPSPEAIAAMGLKREAKAIATEAGVPVVTGYHGADQSDATLCREAERVGFPVLLKASAGGGGKGMRVVHERSRLEESIEGARREAKAAFGDDTLLIEKYLEHPRHIEIQILGDEHGNLVHLFERECSIQRRHQKVVEESPSPLLTPPMRQTMGDCAVRIGKAIGYSNAGTVEFIATNDGSFYFLEVNTRLQVEHPVTECVTGLDLVREQIRIARGEALGYGQADVAQKGAAIEVRLYAEDPATGFLPSTGTLVDYHMPKVEGLRIDSGVEAQSSIDIHYDPMLAKLVTFGRDREEARQRMTRALRHLSVLGVMHNATFLRRVLEHPAFIAAALHTHFVDQHFGRAIADAPTDLAVSLGASAATIAAALMRSRSRRVLPTLRSGFRNNRFADEESCFELDGQRVVVRYREVERDVFAVKSAAIDTRVRVVSFDAPQLVFETADGWVHRARVVIDGNTHFVHLDGVQLRFVEEERFPRRDDKREAGACVAPMPGKVIAVRAEVGRQVADGEALVVLEAMKMEHTLRASRAGLVKEVRVRVGQQVEADALLVVVDAQ